MPWTIDLLSLDGTSTFVTAAPFRSARVTWAADGVGALEVNLRPGHVAGGDWHPGARRVLVRDPGGAARFGGFLNRLERGGKPGDIQYRAAGLGLASILEKRVVVGDRSYVEKVATDIALGLLAHIAGQAYDQTGFTEGTVTGVADTLTRHFCDGDVIKDALDELANRSPGGFAWEIGPTGKFNAWVGGRGSDLTGTYTLAPADVNDWSFVMDTDGWATYVMGIGDRNDDQPCGPPLVETFHASRSTYGRWEVAVGADTTDEGEMLDVAEEELRARVAALANLQISYIEGRGPWDFGDVWLGDSITVAAGDEFQGDWSMRCIGVSISFEPGTHEFVEMEFEAA